MPPNDQSSKGLEAAVLAVAQAVKGNQNGLNKKLIAYGYRDNSNITVTPNPVVVNTYYRFKNSAGTANLSVPFTSSGGQVLIEITATVWASTNSYRNVRPVVDGVAQPEMAASYLSSGVAPGSMLFPVSVGAGAHTLEVEVQSTIANTLDYRAVIVQVYEIM